MSDIDYSVEIEQPTPEPEEVQDAIENETQINNQDES